jgi:hypothetical protein
VTSPVPSVRPGSRSAAYLVAGVLATVPAGFVLMAYLGAYAGLGAVVMLWTTGVFWLLKRRHDDPTWDHGPVSGRR